MLSSIILPILFIIIIALSIKCYRHSRRIHEIRRVIRSFSQGDFSSRMVLAPSDRLGDVALNINELAQEIQRRLQEMTNEKEKLEAILSNMAEGVLVISAQERLLHLSPRFLDMFEVRSQDWSKKYYWEIIANQTINESIREAITHKKVLRRNITLVHPQEIFFTVLISPVMDASGVLMSVVAVFHDVTEFKKYERLRTEFVANVSHELKTPLTSIKGFVETLQAGAIDDKTHALRFLDIIAKQTRRLEDLVQDLLILSSLESKDVKMNFIQSGVASVISSVVLMKKKQMEEQGQTLEVDIAPDLPFILMDTQRMEQVFLNLLDNAVKFTPAGGKIKIKAGIEKRHIRVDIIDNGPGISSENLSRIFERFFRADKSRNQETGGTGLGLSIVKHIVEAHQGTVNVESTLGRGASFSVYLPLDMI
ncbi:MAG: PAS domain-containing protein [Candidatus Omnitrophica bacterium]|nr:PAS domain-containing protein [Candidatus Omnitrophota bacterium]